MLRESSFYAPPDMLSERKRGEYNVPYVSHVNAQERMFNGENQLSITVGLGDHTRDLNHPLYAFLLNMWYSRFSSRDTNLNKWVVGIEGPKYTIPPNQTIPQLIAQGGALRLLHGFAQESGVRVISIEPQDPPLLIDAPDSKSPRLLLPESDETIRPYAEASQLSSQCTTKAKVLYYDGRLVPQLFQEGITDPEPVEAIMQERLDWLQASDPSLTADETSFRNFRSYYKEEYGIDFKIDAVESERMFYETQGFMHPEMLRGRKVTDSSVCIVAQEVNYWRNENYKALQRKLSEKGWNTLFIMGIDHYDNVRAERESFGRQLGISDLIKLPYTLDAFREAYLQLPQLTR